jgi:hypothetical protein
LQDLPHGDQAHEAWGKPARSKTERRAHVLHLLETEDKLWIATASADGSAHLVPFSFVWDGQRVSMATSATNPAARNAARTGNARLALGDFGDVVLIDGPIAVAAPQDLGAATAERLKQVSAIDARQVPGFVYLQLTPQRIQAWWSAGELGTPTIMRDGQWLT